MENLYTVSNVFSDRIFRVPDYQRGYAWEERQCRDFVEDLELLGPNTNHFMGLLILHARTGRAGQVLDRHGKAYQEYDVIDGQQRLTTLVLYLDALHDEMEGFDSLRTMAEGIQDTYIELRDLNDQRLPKLRLNRDTHAFYCNSVLGQGQDQSIEPPRIRSHELLLAARAYFRAHLAEKRREMQTGYAQWLMDEFLKVAQQLTLVVYTVHSEADAGVVFETMNNRGKDLTELEKTKNYLLYLATKLDLPDTHDLAETINDAWTHLFERLMAAGLSGVDDEDRLLRAHWLMVYDYDPKKWGGSRSIKARFNLRRYKGRHADLLADLKAYLASLKNAVIAYCDIFAPGHTNAFGAYNGDSTLSQRIVAAAKRLVRLDALATFLPLLIAARLRNPSDGKPYLEALELCERFAFRVYRWLERQANTGQSWAFRLGNRLYDTGDMPGVLNELQRRILYYCPDQRFLTRFEERTDWYHWRGLKYMLYEYEQALAEQAGQAVLMPWEIVARKEDTIEHVLPQAWDAGGYWAARFSPEEHERWLHDIGNLTLTFDNSCLGNKPFPEKKGTSGQPCCYAISKLFIEQALARYEDWTPETIQARRQEIRAWAERRWAVAPVEPSAKGPEDEAELARRAVVRRFIPRGQMLLYKVLYEAEPDGVFYDELHEKMGVTRTQLLGVLGALGRRINLTDGLKNSQPGTAFLLKWSSIEGSGRYAMQPRLIEVLEEIPALHDILRTWSVQEIDARFRTVWEKDWDAQRTDLDLPVKEGW